MRSSLRLTSIFALVCGVSACGFGCGGGDTSTQEPADSELPDTSALDTGVAEVEVDSGEIDSSMPDTTVEETASDTGVDSSLLDTGPDDTGTPDTGPFDTGTPDTGPFDTGTPDTGPFDTGTPDTGPFDTGTPDTGPVDTGPPCIVGGACDDGNACTLSEKYDSECKCGGGTALSCEDSNACTTDTCDMATGCKHANLPNGTACGTGRQCNVTSGSTTSFCEVVCTPGTACDDSNACTTGEKLDDSCKCVGGTTISCADTNVCTTDACSPTTGCTFTPLADGSSCGGTKVCKASACIDPSALLPTIKITAPAALTKKGFKATGPGADVCDPLPFTLTVSAPEQIQTVSWHFFTPTTAGGMNGDSCGAPTTALPPWRTGLGTPIYAHKVDEAKYAGTTGGSFTENVAVSGLFSGGLWLWCTTPGTGGTAFLTAANGTPIPAINGGLQPLSRYCHSTTLPTDTDTAKQWTLIVQLTDKAGNKATDEIKFWVYKL